MKAAKNTDSIPDDILATILKEFLPEFAFPVTSILQEAVENHTWPADFKKEYHLSLKKTPIPASEDELRGIVMSALVSKQLERLVLNRIWPYLKPHIDPDQMGGMAGCSVEHNIIKMVHFVLGNMDGDTNAAVIAVPVDYSKAFNRMLNSDNLCNLSALNVPKYAIKPIKSYFTGRTMCTRYKGAISLFHKLPGGGPQGGLLMCVFFILQVNKADSPCVLPALRQNTIPLPASQTGPAEDPAKRQSDSLSPSTQSGPTNELSGITLPANLSTRNPLSTT